MKRFISFFLCAAFIVTAFASCSGEASDTGTDTVGITEQSTEKPEPLFEQVDPTKLTPNKTYDNDHGSLLSAYEGKTVETYEGVCVYYEENGWELYCENEMNKNLFSTYINGSKLAHVYFIDTQKELNIVTSDTGAENLPPKEINATGTKPTTVTQLQLDPSQTSGMAYIVQLSDGSFIVYDGGYQDTVTQFLKTIRRLAGGPEIHIRAWVITHSHADHYSCFKRLSNNYSAFVKRHDVNIKLDYLMIAPMDTENAMSMTDKSSFFAYEVEDSLKAFEGAKLCYVHTGMTFNFCNMTMEILFSAEELFIDGSTGNSNDASLVSRLYSNQKDSGETLSFMILGDACVAVAERMMSYYGDYLKSDMCQAAHHGVENFPLNAYQMIKPSIIFYPCHTPLYNAHERFDDVRKALRESEDTKEVLLRDDEEYVRYFNPSLNPPPVPKPIVPEN